MPDTTHAFGYYEWLADDPAGPHHARPAPNVPGLSFRRRDQRAAKSQMTDMRAFFSFPPDVPVPPGFDVIGKGDASEIKVNGKVTGRFRDHLGIDVAGDTLAQCLLDAFMRGDPDGVQSHRPLMPDRRGRLRIGMGRRGDIINKRFDIDGPYGGAVVDNIRRGFFVAQESGVPEDQLRKRLGAATAKHFGRWSDSRHTLFHTGSTFDLTPLRPATRYDVDFSEWSGWTQPAAEWTVSAGKAVHGGLGVGFHRARYDSDISDDDMQVGVFVDTLPAGNYQFGTCGRFTSGVDDTCYMIRCLGTITSDMRLDEVTAGSFTNHDIYAALVDNAWVYLECDGSTIEGYEGAEDSGTLRINVTDGSIAGASFTRGGLNGYNTVTGDDFWIKDLAAAFGGRNTVIGGGIF